MTTNAQPFRTQGEVVPVQLTIPPCRMDAVAMSDRIKGPKGTLVAAKFNGVPVTPSIDHAKHGFLVLIGGQIVDAELALGFYGKPKQSVGQGHHPVRRNQRPRHVEETAVPRRAPVKRGRRGMGKRTRA